MGTLALLCGPDRLDRRSWTLLLILASLWGASYLFIEIGLEDLSPAMVVLLRTLLAGVVLVPLALRRGALAGDAAAPWGSLRARGAPSRCARRPSSRPCSAVFIDHDERPAPVGAGGIALGIAGVALLLGVDVGGSSAALVGGLAVVLASLGYALGGFYVKARFRAVQPIGLVRPGP